jgi:predicted O-methyltransferase YrrM
MTRRTLEMTDRLHDYLMTTTLREHPVQKKLREVTAKMPGAGMQIAADQGQFMAMLVRLIGARRAIEIGTYTGYSALSVALALPADGKLICCDVNAETTAVARAHWAEAGVAGKIDLRIAPALATLDSLVAGKDAGPFDMAFIDADKPNYDAYYERCLRLLRPGGLVLIDNVLWGGSVADPRDNDASTKVIRALNAKVQADERVDMCLLPVGDGLTLARKR